MGFLVESSLTGWIGAVGSIIAVTLTIIIYFLTRKKKALSYEVLSEYPLISIDDEIKGNLQILYGGHPVEDVHLLLVKFINSGNVPITTADFERPLTLRLKGKSNVLSAERVKASPDNLTVTLKVEDKVITVEPVLMNGGDFFTAKVLIGQYGGSFDVDARIVGVKSIRVVRRQSQTEWGPREWRFALMAGFAAIFMLASIISLVIVSRNNQGDVLGGTPAVQQLPLTQTTSPVAMPPPTPEATPYETSIPNPTSMTIPDEGQASLYPSEVDVSGIVGIISKVKVGIRNTTHSNMSDLDILLVGPDGRGVILMANVGSGKKLSRTSIVFDDEAPYSPHFKGGTLNESDRPQTVRPILASRAYRPTNYKDEESEFPIPSLTQVHDKLAVFNGMNPNGKWKLYVLDRIDGDNGTISGGWELTILIDPVSQPQ